MNVLSYELFSENYSFPLGPSALFFSDYHGISHFYRKITSASVENIPVYYDCVKNKNFPITLRPATKANKQPSSM